VCSKNPNSGRRKSQESHQSQAGAKPGFTQRLSFGKAVVAFRFLQARDERRMNRLFH